MPQFKAVNAQRVGVSNPFALNSSQIEDFGEANAIGMPSMYRANAR
jgi:hypothetical protein